MPDLNAEELRVALQVRGRLDEGTIKSLWRLLRNSRKSRTGMTSVVGTSFEVCSGGFPPCFGSSKRGHLGSLERLAGAGCVGVDAGFGKGMSFASYSGSKSSSIPPASC